MFIGYHSNMHGMVCGILILQLRTYFAPCARAKSTIALVGYAIKFSKIMSRNGPVKFNTGTVFAMHRENTVNSLTYQADTSEEKRDAFSVHVV